MSYLRSEGSYTPLSPATDSSDTAEVTPIFFGPAPVPRSCGAESEDNRKEENVVEIWLHLERTGAVEVRM